MDHCLRSICSQGAQHMLGSLNICTESIKRSGERRLRITLRGKMKDKIRTSRFNTMLNGDRISQISVMEFDALPLIDFVKMPRNVVQRTTPSQHAVNLPVCMLYQVVE